MWTLQRDRPPLVDLYGLHAQNREIADLEKTLPRVFTTIAEDCAVLKVINFDRLQNLICIGSFHNVVQHANRSITPPYLQFTVKQLC